VTTRKWIIRVVNVAIGGTTLYALFTFMDVEPWKVFTIWVSSAMVSGVTITIRAVFGKDS